MQNYDYIFLITELDPEVPEELIVEERPSSITRLSADTFELDVDHRFEIDLQSVAAARLQGVFPPPPKSARFVLVPLT